MDELQIAAHTGFAIAASSTYIYALSFIDLPTVDPGVPLKAIILVVLFVIILISWMLGWVFVFTPYLNRISLPYKTSLLIFNHSLMTINFSLLLILLVPGSSGFVIPIRRLLIVEIIVGIAVMLVLSTIWRITG